MVLLSNHLRVAQSFSLLRDAGFRRLHQQQQPWLWPSSNNNHWKICGRSLSSSFLFGSSSFSAESPTTSNNISTNFQSSVVQRSGNKDEEVKSLKVAIVGAGAVGSYYGARLHEVGHKCQFYTRTLPDSGEGLQVTSTDGDIHIPADEWHVFNDTKQMQKADWVVVALKSSSLKVIPDLIIPLLQSTTRVLVIMNGLIEDDLVRMIREKTNDTNLDRSQLACCQTLYGGMALICSNRLAPGRIDHSYAGLLSAGVAVSSSATPEEDEEAFRSLFRNTTVPITYDANLLRGRWKKMVWNLPFNGISVAMGGITVDQIVNDPGLRKLAYTIMDETIATANAELSAVYDDHDEWEPLGEAEKDQMMTLSDGMGPYKTSTMLDLTNRRAMEVRYMFREPVKRAEKLGVPVPHLQTLVAMIEAYQRKYGL
eukprot:CAMPEP_0198144318 /NCGR_PEP_ID=MMETSP1443-20131203/14437_1 /TAXON_ID=186043 /ORGANISM="Entomoneis sp., Strain CCMP2396" /LENGTH=424 /DNA_ID=CAMNT_0043807687 /DNA_START=212 /DNA_END=1486 /DNA_ORIENTATION=-